MREPAPLYCLTSAAFAAGENPRQVWESARFPGEDAEPEHELVFGRVPFADDHHRGGARPTSAGTSTRRAASAAGRGGCGTPSWRHERR